MTAFPKVSIILPVYNGEKYLGESMESILAQTYNNFELLIINDGSKDGSLSIIKKYKDKRIKVYTQKNQGLAATLNRGIKLAKGEYLARQDQDDLSLPSRLDKQVNYLNNNPRCGLVGTWSEIINENGTTTGYYHRHPAENDILKIELLFDNPFVHSSVMLRKDVFKKVNGYATNNNWQPPEDYELWSRIARYYNIGNIPVVLHKYREVPGSMSRVGFKKNVIKISARNIGWILKQRFMDPNVFNIAVLKRGEMNLLKKEYNLFKLNKNLNKLSMINKSNYKTKKVNETKKQIAYNLLIYLKLIKLTKSE